MDSMKDSPHSKLISGMKIWCSAHRTQNWFWFIWAGSLNQGAATVIAYSELIFKAIFKMKKIAVVSWKHLGNTHWLGSNSHLLLPGTSSVSGSTLPFFQKDTCFSVSTGIGTGSGSTHCFKDSALVLILNCWKRWTPFAFFSQKLLQ